MNFGRFNLIYGENNAGKSALVRLPALLADSIGPGYEGLNSNSELLQESSTRDVQWRGGLGDEEDKDTTLKLTLKNSGSWKWVLEWRDLDSVFKVSALEYTRQDSTATGQPADFSKELSGMVATGELSAEVRASAEELRALWSHTCWLGTHRVGPSHLGVPTGQTGRLWGSGSSAEAEVVRSSELLKSVSRFYETHLDRSIEVETRGRAVVALMLRPTQNASHTTSFKESGSGLQYIFPVITAAEKLRKEGGLLILEEPEAHLHPRLQRALASHLVEVVERNPGAQILVETHSEVFLLAALEAAVPGDSLGPNDITLHWTEGAKDGSATVERIELDELGRPKTPRFEQAYKTMGEMRRSILSKRRSHGG